MRYLSRLSCLLWLAVLVLCACDKNEDNDNGVVGPGVVVAHVTVYSMAVETVVDAPLVHEEIEQDLAANPPFGGSTLCQLISRKRSAGLPAQLELYVRNPDGEGYFGGYGLRVAGNAEWCESYKQFPAAYGGAAWYKWDFVPISSEDGREVATYDAFVYQPIPSSDVATKIYFCEDLTENYRQRLPGADIHAVARRLVLSYVKSEDIVNE